MTTAFAFDDTPPPIPAAPDALVLAERPLRAGIALADTARYGTDLWELTPAVLQKQMRALTLDFTTIAAPYRQVAKQYCYAQLAGILPDGVRPRRIVTIRIDFSRFKIFTDWLAEHGSLPLDEVTEDELTAFRRDQVARGVSTSWRRGLQSTIRALWTFRDLMPAGHLGFDPGSIDGWFEPIPHRGENATERIPEEILGPLLGWALRFIEDFAPDIFAAREEWARLYARDGKRRQPNRSAGEKTAEPVLRAVLDRYRAAGRPLPSTRRFGGVNYTHLAREVDCTRSNLASTHTGKALIGQALAELGIDDGSYLWTPMTATIGGRLWLERMPFDQYAYYEQRLMACCYIVIAYLSGMRDSEVKHLRRGALSVTTAKEGRLPRYTVTSLAFKGEASELGTEARWIVGAPVAAAVQTLERLQPPEQEWLFAPLPTGHHVNRRREGRAHGNEVLSSKASNEDIAGLIAWVNGTCARLGLPDIVPTVGGVRPRVISSQFRRTLAWHIARRPGGAIAGAIAYRHHSVQMFEGYAGTSAAGFRAEVEAEQALTRGEHLAVMVERHDHERLHGPAADEGRLRMAEFGRHAGFDGTISTDRRQLAKLLARHDPHVYPGRFVTCVHNPDRALCSGGKKTPTLGDCQPLACRNAAFTADNETEWHRQLTLIDDELAGRDLLAPYIAQRLADRRRQIDKLFKPDDQDR